MDSWCGEVKFRTCTVRYVYVLMCQGRSAVLTTPHAEKKPCPVRVRVVFVLNSSYLLYKSLKIGNLPKQPHNSKMSVTLHCSPATCTMIEASRGSRAMVFRSTLLKGNYKYVQVPYGTLDVCTE